MITDTVFRRTSRSLVTVVVRCISVNDSAPPSQRPIRVLLTGYHQIVLAGLRLLLETRRNRRVRAATAPIRAWNDVSSLGGTLEGYASLIFSVAAKIHSVCDGSWNETAIEVIQ